MLSFFSRNHCGATAANKARPSSWLRLEALDDRCLPSGGVVDPTFGTGGFVPTQVGSYSQALAIATSPIDGKVVVAGYADVGGNHTSDDDFAVVRFNLDGTLDRKVTTALGGATFDEAYAVVVLSNGKVVAAGRTGNDFALVQYNSDLTLDNTFGGKGTGKVVTDINQRSYDVGTSLIVQPDGKLVVAGMTTPSKGNSPTVADLVLVRYNPDGTLDTSYGSGGKVIRHFSSPVYYDQRAPTVRAAIDPQTGKITVVAALRTGIGIARYNRDGSPDTSFGGGSGYTEGYLLLGSGTPKGLALRTDGRILLAGSNVVERLNSDGTPDGTFGISGHVTIPAAPNVALQITSAMIEADGNILVGGSESDVTLNRFMVARLDPSNGSLDTSLGTNGIAASAGPIIYSPAMALEPDGRIVLAADTTTGSSGVFQMAVTRFLATGPQIGSFTASPNPATTGSDVTLTASSITDANPGATITQVAFYADSNGDGVLDSSDALLGYGTQKADGSWSLTFSAAGWTPGTYTFFAQVTDSYGVLGDPLTTTFQIV